MTHEQLVQRAVRWLKTSAVIPNSTMPRRKVRCSVVLDEPCSAWSEQPDVIGWCFGGCYSLLIECKASRADFLADKNKRFRKRPKAGMGMYRWYMVPSGMVSPEEVPEGWGLLWTTGKRVFVKKDPARQPKYNRRNEFRILVSELSYVQMAFEGKVHWDSRMGRRVKAIAEALS